MHRRTFLTVSATVAFGSLGLLGGCEKKQPDKATGRRQVTVAQWGQEKYLIYLPVYLAQEAGIFESNKLDVTLNFSGNDDQVFAAVARGDAHFGIGDPVFAAISRDRGSDGVVVGQLVGRVALWGVSKNTKRLLSTPEDFAKLTIGTFPRPSTAIRC